MRERVFVAGEPNVHGLRTNNIGRPHFGFKVGSEGQTGGVKGLHSKRGNDTSFADLCIKNSPADAVEIRVGMDVTEADALLNKWCQRLAPKLRSVLRISSSRQSHRRSVRDRRSERIVG